MFGAIVFATKDASLLHDLLDDLDGVVIDRHPGRTIVRVDAFDAVLEFVGIE